MAVERVLSTHGRDDSGKSVALAKIQTPDGKPQTDDADGDGRMNQADLTAWVLAKKPVAIVIELMIGDEGTPLFELLDGNTDRRLTAREIREGFTRLASVNRNHDSQIAQSELESRDRMTFSFGRNQVFTPNTNSTNMTVIPRLRSPDIGPLGIDGWTAIWTETSPDASSWTAAIRSTNWMPTEMN